MYIEDNSLEKQKRNQGIDLIKILAMLMIVTLHVLGCGGILGASVSNEKNCAVAWLLEVAAFGAVNLYGMASGYLCTGKQIRYKNIGKLWLLVVFYTISITAIFFVVVPGTVGPQQMINAVFPVMTAQYWYFTGYFCMFFFLPVMNAAIAHLEKRQLQMVLTASFLLFSVLPTVFGADPFHENDGYSVLWLCVLYMAGGYIRTYGLFEKLPQAALILMYLVLSVITWATAWIRQGIEITLGGWISYLSPTIVFASLALFVAGTRIRIKRGQKVLSLLASATFGVYLIHTHPLIWHHLLYNRFVFLAGAGLRRLLPGLLAAVLAIFAGCMIIELIRHGICAGMKRLVAGKRTIVSK